MGRNIFLHAELLLGELMKTTQVLISGGGPVGMTLAYLLAHYGIRSVLCEKNTSTTTHPKMDITNARSMELFEKVGLAKKLREVAINPENCFDVSWITHLTGWELHRFEYPGEAEMDALIRTVNDGSQPSQSWMRVSQVLIEPVMKKAIEENPLVDVMFASSFERYEEDANGVTGYVLASDGERIAIRADYLVGCDGGGSTVRKQLNIGLSGEFKVNQRYITHFKSNDLRLLQRWGTAWHYQSNLGTLVAQNDIDTWTLLSRIPDGVAPEDIDPADLLREFIGEDIEFELLVSNSWGPHLVVADSFGRGRVWLAGDSVHQVIPTGGYGMNTGVGDAFDIGWKLAAILKGFAGSNLLQSYENERRPVALANRDGSGRHNQIRIKIANLYSPILSENSADGATARKLVGQQIADIGNAENECVGLELGYCYKNSPVICHDGAQVLNLDPLKYIPTTTPGARLPSVFLPDGDNIYNLLGDWFTLLCFEEYDAKPFMDVASKFKIPVKIQRVNVSDFKQLYPEPILLVRPDHHIAWRGDFIELMENAESIIKTVLGL